MGLSHDLLGLLCELAATTKTKAEIAEELQSALKRSAARQAQKPPTSRDLRTEAPNAFSLLAFTSDGLAKRTPVSHYPER